MPNIVIKNLDNCVVSTNDASKSILGIMQENFVDWMHACGGKGRCTTCKAIILSGGDNLEPPTAHEERFTDLGALAPNERLACQCVVKQGEIVVMVPERSKLPHMTYSE